MPAVITAVPASRYRLLETVLGFYEFATHYTVFIGASNPHSPYTAVHEHTHAVLGYGSSFGLFQQFLVYLHRAGPPALSAIATDILFVSIDDVRELHEATATFAEFMAAYNDKYTRLHDMESTLPIAYSEWRALYDNIFPDDFPFPVRSFLASHLSRYAMDTDILTDYRTLSPNASRTFARYLSNPAKSPGKRFRSLLSYIRGCDQHHLFRHYLNEYFRVENDLADAWKNLTIENRRRSFAIQRSLTAALEIDVQAIPIINASVEISHTMVALANMLVAGWKEYARRQLDEVVDYYFRNTDEDEMDPIHDNARFYFPPTPQAGLIPLLSIAALRNPEHYLASVIEWMNAEPFLLSESPRRLLITGDCYVRLLPIVAGLPPFFVLSSERDLIRDVLKAKFSGVFFPGETYRRVGSDLRTSCGDRAIIVHWGSWSEFAAEVALRDGTELAGTMVGDAQGFILRIVGSGEYHLIFTPSSDSPDSSRIFEEIKKASPTLRKLVLDPIAMRAFQTLFRNAAYLMG